ncbi:hypothetical protein [Rhodoplanes roseus]|uniref:Uncharacterized protein n=1 Tax=Rhodoplanes roseus TaxID=29409 RepID=A0A327L5H5_9BRAD|nr:hypothetical protein [Rhodoplanes roseus]RAI45285.1 hypothetical protein CH341_04630 [Rhodoplanes roseus]
MTEKTIDLDQHRGMAAQHATELRRMRADVEANAKALQERQLELEMRLLASPARSWAEAAEKAQYLLSLLADSPAGQDPRRKRLIADVVEEFRRLGNESSATS